MTKTPANIVIIDDEKGMCDSLAALLRGEGHEVTPFLNPAEAVELVKKAKVDLVITDIRMPEMDGLEVLKAVKAVDDGIPVILLTGYASLDSALGAIGQGAYDYLLKPVDYNRLELSVKRALERRWAELSRLRLVEELRLSNLILKQRVGELNALYEAGKSIGSSADLTELLRQIVVLASSVTEAEVGSIMLLDEAGERLTIKAAIGLHDDIVKKTSLPIGASIAGYVAKTGEPLIISDVEQDGRFKRINRERYGAASLLCAPLRIKNKVLGVINMAKKSGGQVFNRDDLRLLVNFASQAAVAVDDAYQFEKNRRRLIEHEILLSISRELPKIDTFTSFRNILKAKLGRVFAIDYTVWFDWDAGRNCLVPAGASGKTDLPMTESGKIDLNLVERDDISVSGIDLSDVDLDDIAAFSALVADQMKGNRHLPQPREAFMAIPITRSGELVNVFYLGAQRDLPYSDDDISLARLVISQAAVLFEKEKTILNATRLMTMGNMISEISHDLRKPLTSIKGGLQIVRKRWPEVAEESDFFKTAEEEVHRMNDLVRELVDFSNPNRYETTRVDLRRLVDRVIKLLDPDLRKNKVKAQTEFSDADWEVIINKNQMMEVFINLLINAIDAMPDGGTLKIQGLIETPPHRSEDFLAVRVIDSGVGIKKEDLSRVFERYHTTKETGTGLGLAVVERVVGAHNGRVHIESEVGQGTTFTIYLPLNL